jgi:putative nucleotidyltransferase with HDIG domain
MTSRYNFDDIEVFHIMTNQLSEIHGDGVEDSESRLTVEDIFKRMSRVHELPTLSAIAVQVNSMLDDINTSAGEVALIIEKDHAIVPKLLKLVNSSFFGFKNRVSNISHAVMLMGFNTVRNAVVSISVIDSFVSRCQHPDFNIMDAWRHAINVGVVGQYLDRMTGGRFHDTVFTAGLIHDIGKLIMLKYYEDRFFKVIERMQEKGVPFSDVEQQQFPMSHTIIGARLAMQWKLPEIFNTVIAYHHNPDKCRQDNALPMLIHTADAFVNNTMNAANSKNTAWPICMNAWKSMPGAIRSLKEEMSGIKKEAASACGILLKGG